MSGRGRVLICGEYSGNRVTSTTAELIRQGRIFSDLFEESLHLLLIGDAASEAAEEAVHLGADIVHLAPGLPFPESHPESFLTPILRVTDQIEPSFTLFGQTDMGRETAPLLAARIEASVCLDCIRIEVDPETGSFLFTKPVYGGNALAVWTSGSENPQVITIRPRSMEPAQPDMSRKGKIFQVEGKIEEPRFKGKLLETVREEAKGIKLEDAKMIVTGGGGIGGKDGFRLLEELAAFLRGAVGISRVPCDEGWMPKSLEIGQTGLVVSPDLYIAVGISGAPQHMAGCSQSKTIVAVNKDAEAHIFQEADYGIVGDYREALPAFFEMLKTLLEN